ncbi:interactor protein for cytohesin exchange factors 1 [Halichoeres trimaculatus]|uniref:interactor protein for cytohesin exchange factors 1 n=1 Tax=Halichoeres trimaculatus TaxID=147232 RepID=UPI003D9ED03D
MSRRRVSVKDLGLLDCEGWLQRRKEGRSFLGSKWKRYWFVLKKSCLYWYPDKTAEKAEGFINLSGFSIEQAKQSRKKHAIIASHPQVVTVHIAAESFADMNKWISKLSEAAETSELVDTEECYSEDSDQDCDESAPCPLNSEQVGEESKNGESSPCGLDIETRRRSTLEGAGLSRNRIRRKASEGRERLSWLDLPRPEGRGDEMSVPVVQVEGERMEDVIPAENPQDELESLYIHLKSASLSPIGRCGQRDFRASFIRRCQNDQDNEKLHLLRILSSTLKAKESDLQTVDQILTDPSLSAPSYRTWRDSNLDLVQEIIQRNQTAEAAGGAAELGPAEEDSVT